MEKKDLRSLTIEEMTEVAENMGQKAFRGNSYLNGSIKNKFRIWKKYPIFQKRFWNH